MSKPEFKTHVVYVLICPTSGDIRYVGSTSQPESRKRYHQSIKSNPFLAVDKWTNALAGLGTPAEFRVLATVNAGGFMRGGATILPAKTAGNELERLVIIALTKQGCDLLNVYGKDRDAAISRADLWDVVEGQLGLTGKEVADAAD